MRKVIQVFVILLVLVSFGYAQEADSTATVPKRTVDYGVYQKQVDRNVLLEKVFLNEFLNSDKTVVDLYLDHKVLQESNKRFKNYLDRLASELIKIDNKELKVVLKKYGIK